MTHKFYNHDNAGRWLREQNPGGPLLNKLCYQPRTKIHVNRVVFRDQTRNVCYVFRVINYMKYAKKGRNFNAPNFVDRVYTAAIHLERGYFSCFCEALIRKYHIS